MTAPHHQRPPGAAGYSDANKYRARTDVLSERKGCRTKFTEAQLADALRRGAGIFAEAVRILHATHGRTYSISSLGRAVNASPHLQGVLAETCESRLDYAESQLWKRIEAGDGRALEFYLKCKGSHRGWKQTVQHSGDKDNPVQTEVKMNFDGVPVDQLRTMLATLDAARAKAVGADAIDPDSEDGGDPLPPPPPLSINGPDQDHNNTRDNRDATDIGPR